MRTSSFTYLTIPTSAENVITAPTFGDTITILPKWTIKAMQNVAAGWSYDFMIKCNNGV
jgi:hypothetical protein